MILLFVKRYSVYINPRNPELPKTHPNITKFWENFVKEYNYEHISASMHSAMMTLICVEEKNKKWGSNSSGNKRPGGIFIGALDEEGKD